jgi:hypothetical protein
MTGERLETSIQANISTLRMFSLLKLRVLFVKRRDLRRRSVDEREEEEEAEKEEDEREEEEREEDKA